MRRELSVITKKDKDGKRRIIDCDAGEWVKVPESIIRLAVDAGLSEEATLERIRKAMDNEIHNRVAETW